jgi:hypothetical protein
VAVKADKGERKTKVKKISKKTTRWLGFAGDASRQRATERAKEFGGRAYRLENLPFQDREKARAYLGLDLWNRKDGIAYEYVVAF